MNLAIEFHNETMYKVSFGVRIENFMIFSGIQM